MPKLQRILFLTLYFYFFQLTLTAQTTTTTGQKELSARFPENKCIASEERINYTFDLITKEKNTVFTIQENGSSSFFATEHDYDFIQSLFFDDFSEIPTLKCTLNKKQNISFPVMEGNYESSGIFHDDLKVSAYKINMEKGKTYDVTYTKNYYNPRLFSKIYFHENYPIHKKTLSFEIPDWVDIELKPVNFEGYTLSKKEFYGKKNLKTIQYEIDNIEAIANEPHSPSSAKYLPHLLVFIKSYTQQKQSEKFFSTHADIYKWCKQLVDSVNNEEKDLIPLLDEIKKGETDSFKIMTKVFYWVQEHVRYIAFEDGIMGYKPMSAKKVGNMLYGDCKGMANLTKCLLKLAGIDARLTWIGTNDIPYNNDLPLLAVYNHMICTAFLKGKKYFLDATENYIAVNDYADRIQGRPVMIENGNTYINDEIPQFGCEHNKQEDIISMIITGNSLKGTATLNCYGEQKTSFLRSFSGLKTENRDMAIKNFLKGENPNTHIIQYKTSNLNEREKTMQIQYEFELKNAVYTKGSKELLVFPEKDNDFEQLEFDSLRKNDYEFNNRYFISSVANIKLPARYKIKYMPDAIHITNTSYEFNLYYELKDGIIILNKEIKIKSNILNKKQFSEWNENVKKLKTFYHSPIILTAI